MKKISGLVLVASVVLLASSCEKHDFKKHSEKTVTQTVDVTLEKNAAYSYTLPENTSDDAFQITTQSEHAGVSTLTNNGTNTVYTYTPAKDYVGTDKVVIATIEEEHSHHMGGGAHHPHHSGGGCNNGNHNDENSKLEIIINITIKDKVTEYTTKTKAVEYHNE